jgi:hypothetical protein
MMTEMVARVLCVMRKVSMAAEREIDQISGKPVGSLLNRCAGLFRPFHRFNDLAEGGLFAQAFDQNMKRTGLIDRAGIHGAACHLFTGHGFASNGRFLYKGVAADHLAIDRDSVAGANEDNLAGEDGIGGHIEGLAGSQHACSLRQKVEHVLNGTAATAYGQPFEDFSPQNEGCDHQSCKVFPDRQRGEECDGHREFHRHAALDDVLQRLLEDGVAPNQRGHQADYADPMKRLPKMEPDCRRRQGNKDHTKNFNEFKAMFMGVVGQ